MQCPGIRSRPKPLIIGNENRMFVFTMKAKRLDRLPSIALSAYFITSIKFKVSADAWPMKDGKPEVSIFTHCYWP